MLVSGKEALQANSDRHLTASWKESMVAAKCFSNTFAVGRRESERVKIRISPDDASGLNRLHASPRTY